MSMLISNAAGAYGQVGVENNGRTVYERKLSGPVSKYDPVVIDQLTDTGADADLIVTVAAGDGTLGEDHIGVALDDGVAGDVVRVVEHGPAIINTGAAATEAGWLSLSAANVPVAGQTVVFVGRT